MRTDDGGAAHRAGLLRSFAPSPGGRRARAARRGPPRLVRWRERLAQLRAADARGPPRPSRPRRLLDLHLHQLAAHPPVSSGLGREIRGRRPDHHRRAYARVRLRARPRQRRRAVARLRRRVPGRHRQRLRRLAALREPLLAGAVHRRRRGPHPLPPFRRGRVRDDRDGRSSSCSSTPVRTTSTRTWSPVEPRGLEVAADWARCERPRRTWAMARARASRRTTSRRFDEPHAYAARRALPLNHWALSGTWTVARHAASSTRPADGSPSSSTPATSTSSWARRRRARRSRSASPRRAGRRGAHGTDVQADGTRDRRDSAPTS